jgi:hypothetical protein
MGTREILSSMACAAGIVLLCGNASVLTANVIEPTVDGSVRDYDPKDGIPDIILDNSIVQILNVPSSEDRGVIEFRLSGLSQPVINAELFLPVFASDGSSPSAINVFAYAGDGNLTLSDWSQGIFMTSFLYSGVEAVTLDVTSFISSAVAAKYPYAGFNFRFAIPSEVDEPFLALGSLEYPLSASLSVTETPEPGVLTLMLLGVFVLTVYSGLIHLGRRRNSIAVLARNLMQTTGRS